MKRFVNKVVLVTGGANGAGAASVRQFSEKGARVAIGDRDADASRALEQELADTGHTARFILSDVSKPDQAEHAVHATLMAVGRIDVPFNPAGVIIVKPFFDCCIAEVALFLASAEPSFFNGAERLVDNTFTAI